MNKRMYVKFLCLVILIALAAPAVFAATNDAAPAAPVPAPAPAPAPKDPEKVLARVESYEIKEKDVDALLEAAGPEVAMMYDNEEGRKLILDDLVASRLFALSGKKQGLDETPEFKSILDSFVTQNLARAAVEKVLQDIAVTEEECRKFYDENPDQFNAPEQVRASHILLADDVTSADKTALIMGEIANGVSFDVLAREHSIDPSAQQSGGDLGFFGRGQMVPEFEEAAFALQAPGDINPSVKSDFGWHIIKLEEKMASSVIPYDEAKPQIEQYLSNEKMSTKYEEVLGTLKTEYKVEVLP